MAKRMLIDAAHPEEIRVAVLKGNRLEDFDFETATKKQLKGNIYLAKVTRVEPSLQAAFVDYGGNRHGFLAFNEIHPDYYRIPIADREALLEQEKVAAERNAEANGDGDGEAAEVEIIGGDDVEEVSPRRFRPYRPYKIQEVTKRRQILLVQVVKEERGNKGAALTTYLSLAGRYCVLMPNTPRGGGISRKITNLKDRRRLKSILEEFEVPEGMSVIVRTAGMERSKVEIKRDLEYLMRLWDEIRELTLKSSAPALIYEEASLIKRAIRDLYDRDIDDIQVEGDDGYRAAKDFMRMLTPSHAKRVQQYKDDMIPLFHRFQVEGQIDAIHSPTVNLKSGGYIVITPTEALVSIDVNSGRSTKERNIEETALKTNSEAAEEIARQLRLRDLAGLIVIDFIDMEEARNNATVERKLKEAMRVDRARLQIGRISAFGLLELSRQRLRPSLVEATMQHCVYCGGSGWVRSIESATLHVLRGIEEEGIRQRTLEIRLTVPGQVALYLLNQKRAALADMERRYRFTVQVDTDDQLIPPAFKLDRIKEIEAGALPPPLRFDPPPLPVAAADDSDEDETAEDESEADEDAMEGDAPSDRAEERERAPEHRASHQDGGPRHQHPGQPQPGNPPQGEEGGRRRRRRRRRRRGGQGQPGQGSNAPYAPGTPQPDHQAERHEGEQGGLPYEGPSERQHPDGGERFAGDAQGNDGQGNDLQRDDGPGDDGQYGSEQGEAAPTDGQGPAGDGEGRRRRARGRRGGRRRRRGGDRQQPGQTPGNGFEPDAPMMDEPATDRMSGGHAEQHAPAPAPSWTAPAPIPRENDFERGERNEAPPRHEPPAPSPRPEPVPVSEPVRTSEPARASEPAAPSLPVITVGESSDDQQPKKRGWWKRLTD